MRTIRLLLVAALVAVALPARAQVSVPSVTGVDVYHGDGTCDFAKAYNAGARFCIVKATQGTTLTDSALKRNLTGARKAGLYVGVYCYFRATGDAAAQANYMMDAVKAATGAKTRQAAFRNLLVPTIDLEDAGSMTRDQYVASALAFIKQVQETLGRGCITYSYPAFVREHVQGAKLAPVLGGYPLWLASYPRSKQPTVDPSTPAPWARWLIWQYAEGGTWPGIESAGDTDLNVYRGQAADLERWVVR